MKKFKGMSEKVCAAKYANKTFGSWQTTKLFLKESTWYANVRCIECGEELTVSVSCLSQHRGCNCKKFLQEREYRRIKPSTFSALEKIWPKVIKAGRNSVLLERVLT